MSDVAERFRRVATGFTRVVEQVPPDAWERPTPCDGWVARDVVAHLVGWLPGPGFLLGAFDVDAGPLPPVDDDPLGAWAVARDAVQSALDDPQVASRVADCGPMGRLSFTTAVERTVLPDVLIHTWDLARAVGVDTRLDPDEVARQAAAFGRTPPKLDQLMRASGQFGPRVEVAQEADDQARLLAFMGRRA
jgi:uncharacterized protein (TIGR03086 family)